MPAATPSATGLFAPPPVQATASQLRARDASSSTTDFEGQLKDAQQAQSASSSRADASSSNSKRAGDKTPTKAKSNAPSAKRAAKPAKKPRAADGQDDPAGDTTTDGAADGSSTDSPAGTTGGDADSDAPADDAKDDASPEATAGSGAPASDVAEIAQPVSAAALPQLTGVRVRPPTGFKSTNPRVSAAPPSYGRGVMHPDTGANGSAAPQSTTDAEKAGNTAADDSTAAAPGKAMAGQSVPTVSPLDADPDADVPFAATAGKSAAAKATASTAQDTAQAAADAAGAVASLVGDAAPAPKPAGTSDSAGDDLTSGMLAASLAPASAAHHTATGKALDASPADAAPLPNETQFADANHANIVSDVRSALLPHGGTMQIRLDPPELGALQVSVEVRNGTVNATFQTSNDDATRLLSHSLGQLKTALESQGVTVDKISVQQAPRDQKPQGDSSQQQQQSGSQARQEQQREQQRREMLQRMWARVSGQPMPVDLMA